MNGLVNEKLIMKAWVHLRKTNMSIPNETLDFMRDISIERIKEIESGIEAVCEFTLFRKTKYGIKYYESDCGLDYESPDGRSKYCRGCGKPIKIKGE